MKNKNIYSILVVSAIFASFTVMTNAEKKLQDVYPLSEPCKKDLPMVYFDALAFKVTGRCHAENNYHRLPLHYKSIVRHEVWDLSKNSTGLAIHFTTNSPKLTVKWTLAKDVTLKNMTKIASGGLDLYCFIDGEWQYVNSAFPNGHKNTRTLATDMDSGNKDFLLNLPLCAEVEKIEIGIQKDFAISACKQNHYVFEKPIVFYGTSITQGEGASRPGMSYTSIISRKLHVEVINLGFCKNGKFESAIGQAMCEINAGLFVIDCTPNSSPETIKSNSLSFIRQLRKCHPETPILIVESIIREHSYFSQSDQQTFGSLKYIQAQNNELSVAYKAAADSGIDNLYYLNSNDLNAPDHEGSVDGTHLSDLGQYRIAEKIGSKIRDILILK